MNSNMGETQFLLTLQKTKKSYKWHLTGNKIRGKARNGKDSGKLFDPITAVSRYTGNGSYDVNQRGRKRAGRLAGLSTTLTGAVIAATDAKGFNGYSQVLRGKIKQILEL